MHETRRSAPALLFAVSVIVATPYPAFAQEPPAITPEAATSCVIAACTCVQQMEIAPQCAPCADANGAIPPAPYPQLNGAATFGSGGSGSVGTHRRGPIRRLCSWRRTRVSARRNRRIH